MSKIQRYKFERDDLADCNCDIEINNKGYYVEFEDHEKALAEQREREIQFLKDIKISLERLENQTYTTMDLAWRARLTSRISELEKEGK